MQAKVQGSSSVRQTSKRQKQHISAAASRENTETSVLLLEIVFLFRNAIASLRNHKLYMILTT